jgi:hypothetical protein
VPGESSPPSCLLTSFSLSLCLSVEGTPWPSFIIRTTMIRVAVPLEMSEEVRLGGRLEEVRHQREGEEERERDRQSERETKGGGRVKGQINIRHSLSADTSVESLRENGKGEPQGTHLCSHLSLSLSLSCSQSKVNELFENVGDLIECWNHLLFLSLI